MQRLLRSLLLAGILAASVLLHGCGGGGGGTSTGGGIDSGTVGSANLAILRPSPYPSITIEADYYPGSAPEAGVLAFLQDHLTTVTGKASVTISAQGSVITSPAAKPSYSDSDIAAIEAANRGSHTGAGTVSLYLVFLNGPYATDVGKPSTVGLSYEATGYACFQSVLATNAGSVGAKDSLLNLEKSDLIHEIGHLMGLVNLGTPMVVNHEDAAHPFHCNDTSCAMYYSLLDTHIVPPLYPNLGYCQHCRDDLNATK